MLFRSPDKILIVDDDARIRDLLRRYLTQEGLEVILAEDGKALNRILLRDTVDLIVLDLMMPGEDGLSICRRLRAANDRTPIVMLTAKGEDVDRIVGLEVGADDYLGKPFNPRELLARINAVLRRRPPQEAPGAPSGENEVVSFGPFTFDLGTRVLQKNGEELPLTTGEFAMLKALVRHPRQPLSREKLALLARGREFGSGHDQRRGTGVVQDVGHFGRRQTVVHRDGDGAELGHRVLVVSASPLAIVAGASAVVGAPDAALGVEVVVVDHVYTAAITRPIPYAEGKVAAVARLAGAASTGAGAARTDPGLAPLLAAFGDNRFDLAMLAAAKLPFAVRPKPALLTHAGEAPALRRLVDDGLAG